MAILEIENITKTFARKAAVDQLSFWIAPGTVFGLLGPNGSGKTTTIRMVLRILEPDSGSIRVFGAPLDDAAKRRVGYLPEERGLYKDMPILDHLVFLARLRGLEGGEARHRASHWLERFGAASWAQRKVEELSKGMQQKVQFIGTLLHDPELIILDEPFSGLDPVAAQQLKDVMRELRREGRTIIFSTHQMEQVERSCDEILLIHEGRAVISGKLTEVRQRYGKPSVKLDYEGDLGDIASWSGVDRVDDEGRYAEIRLRDPALSRELLQRLVERVHVRRFEISEASLEDIFIQQVKDATPQPSEVTP
ncbi:MAG: ATP-binding cassette domain-containing protein [Candidatus Eisenbacteria bacterium]|nr:ATP-binding cassette domain-containing protein [Candidatus Eisenbacteria bacterium]